MAENSVEHHGGKGPRTPEQIEELVVVVVAAAGEREAITRLSGCVADLNAAQAAKRELATLSAAEVREALVQRRNSLRGAQ